MESREGDPNINFRIKNSSKKQLQDAHELLIMHKRFEQNAARRMFDRGGLADLGHQCQSFQTSNSRIAHNRDRIPNRFPNVLQGVDHGKKLRKSKCFKDNGYLEQLVPKREISHPPDKNENIDSRLLDLSPNHNSKDHQSNLLRLPKFSSLPPENKEIFYTQLSHIPSLPRFPEIKTQIKQSAKRKVTQKRQLKDDSNQLEADKCLQIHALLRNRKAFHDNTAASSGKTVKLMNFPSARELFNSQKAKTKRDGSNLNVLNFLSAENKVTPKIFRWSNFADGQTIPGTSVKDMNFSNAPHKTASVAVMEKTVGSTILKEKLTAAECKKLNVKLQRTVRFSEFLQEVHFYSPINGSDTSF